WPHQSRSGPGMQDQSKARVSSEVARRTPCSKRSVPRECGMRGAITSRRPDEREGCPEAESESRGSTPQRSGDPEAERVEPHIDMAPDAGRRADALAVVAPGTAADDPEAWIAAREPRRSIRRRTVVGLVPAILNPLPGAAVHVVKPHAFGLNDPTGAVCLRSHGLPQRSQSALPLPRSSPGKAGTGASARGVLPFGLCQKPIFL